MQSIAYIIMFVMFVGFAAIVWDHHKQASRRRDREIALRVIRYLERSRA